MKLESNSYIRNHWDTLSSSVASADEVKASEVAVMVALHGGKPYDNLTAKRYAGSMKIVEQQAGRFPHERLPPTEQAAELHAFRVHLQTVDWTTLVDNSLQQLSWGRTLEKSKLMPVAIVDKPGPPDIRALLWCKCSQATSCKTRQCTCGKYGFKCLPACRSCHGVSCDNAESIETELDETVINSDELDDTCVVHDLPDTLGIDDPDVVDKETVVASKEDLQTTLLNEERCGIIINTFTYPRNLVILYIHSCPHVV
jgi:hypothetical protein